jgi:hypothetical protein
MCRAALSLLPILSIITMTMFTGSATQARAQATEGSIRLSPAMSTVPRGGGPFTVYVVLEGFSHIGQVSYDDDRDTRPDRSVPSEGLGAFQFTIDYDPAIVEVLSIERGPNVGQTGRSFQCLPPSREPDSVTFGCLSPGNSPSGVQGNVTLAAVQLQPRASGLSPLVLSAVVAGPLGDSADVDTGGGAVRVSGTGSGGSATVAPVKATRTPSPPPGSSTRAPTAEANTTSSAVHTETMTPVDFSTPTLERPEGPDDSSNDRSSRIWLWSLGAAAAVGGSVLALAAFALRRGG